MVMKRNSNVKRDESQEGVQNRQEVSLELSIGPTHYWSKESTPFPSLSN